MRTRGDDLSESFLTPSEPEPRSDCSILMIVAGRIQGESLRYKLVSSGFEVDLARSVSAGLGRLAGGSCSTGRLLKWNSQERPLFGIGFVW